MKVKLRPIPPGRFLVFLEDEETQEEKEVGELIDSEELEYSCIRDYKLYPFCHTPPLGFREMKKLLKIINKLNLQ
jgi:hypothetical protein